MQLFIFKNTDRVAELKTLQAERAKRQKKLQWAVGGAYNELTRQMMQIENDIDRNTSNLEEKQRL